MSVAGVLSGGSGAGSGSDSEKPVSGNSTEIHEVSAIYPVGTRGLVKKSLVGKILDAIHDNRWDEARQILELLQNGDMI